MNKIEWDTADGILEEADRWKLFSEHPDQPSETIQFFSTIKPMLSKMRFEDDTRFYHVYEHGTVPEWPTGVGTRATVSQRNLRKVANVIAGRGNSDAAIQYLGHSRGRMLSKALYLLRSKPPVSWSRLGA